VELIYSSSSVATSVSEILAEIQEKLQNLEFISYQNSSGDFPNLQVLDIQYTTSVGNCVNLFFLLGHINLPSDLISGTTIYRGYQPQSSLTKAKIAVSQN
jgi:hypothetical protein